MKAFQLLLTLLAWVTLGLAYKSGSSQVDQLPLCAQSCLITAIQQSTCDVTNKACLCTSPDIQRIMKKCVLQYCTMKESLTTRNITETACDVPIRSEFGHVRATNIALCIVSVACVFARLTYKGLFSIGEFGADDCMVLLAVVAGIPQVVVIDRVIIPNGLGRDVWTVPFDNVTTFLHGLYSLMIAYFLQITLVKLSLLLFLLRIFPRTLTRKLLWATIVVVVMFGLSFSIASIFTCWPINSFWDDWDKGNADNCFHVNTMSWINAGLSIGLDVWMLILPLVEVFRLHLPWRRKLSASFMFFVGTFVTVVSILRLQTLIYFTYSLNPTWIQTKVIFISLLEVNAGIICVCLPNLRIIFVHMFPQLHAPTRAVSQRIYSRYGTGRRTGETGEVANVPASLQHSNISLFTQTVEMQQDSWDKMQDLQMEDLETQSPSSSHSSKTRPSSHMSL